MKLSHIIALLAIPAMLSNCTKSDVPVGTSTGKIVDGMGDYAISDFLYDKDGFVWIVPSSSRYLFKTDGSNTIQYFHDPDNPASIASDLVNDALLDENNILWIATQKGVDRYNPAYDNFEHIKIDDSNNYIVCIARSGSGRTCIATRRNILEFNDRTQLFERVFQIPFITKREPALFFDKSGNLWTQLDNLVLCFDTAYNIKYRQEFNNLNGKIVYDAGRYVWILEDGCLKAVNTLSFHLMPAKELLGEKNDICGSAIMFAREGMLVLFSQSGCRLINEAARTIIGTEEATGIESKLLECWQNGARAVSFGPNGNLWVADRSGGIRHIIAGNTNNFSNDEFANFLIRKASAVSIVSKDNCYVVSMDGITKYISSERKFTDTTPFPQGFIPFVNSTSTSGDGHILVCSSPRSNSAPVLFNMDKNGNMALEKRIQTPHRGLATLVENGNIYVAGAGTILSRINTDGEVEDVANLFNDCACYASLIKNISDGRILVCYTDHSPVIYNPADNSVTELAIEGLTQIYFTAFSEDKLGNVWLGSTDNGLFFYDNKLGTIEKVTGYPEITANGIMTDASGNVFVLGNYSAVYKYSSSRPHSCRPVWMDHSDFPAQRYLSVLPDHTVALMGAESYEWFSEDRLSSPQVVNVPVHVFLTSGKNILAYINTASFTDRKATVHLDRKTEGLNMHLAIMDRSRETTLYTYFYDINKFQTGPRESFDNSVIPLYGVSRFKNKVTFWVSDNGLVAETDPFTITVRMNLLPAEIITPLILIIFFVTAFVLWRVTIKRKREAEAERQKREMTEKLNMENIDFFANISHEFRTPLTLICGAATSMKTEDEKALGIIRRNADRMLKLVCQMLDFNKLDHGILTLKVKKEPISEILNTIKADFEIGAAIKGIQLNLHENDKNIVGWIDRDKFEKILYNLCSNAVKFTLPGGMIDICVTVSGGVIDISVLDTGIGVPENATDIVFDRFYQTKASKKAGGTGIGLYYTRALVNLHHGSITANPRKDGDKVIGSTFNFMLPIQENDYSETEKAENTDTRVSIDRKENLSEYIKEITDEQASGNKPTIMLIDDDYEVVYYLKNMLSKNYNVNFRFDAMSGYKMIEEVHPDIIISDMMMMEMDGIELCRMIKENISMSHIPFVMLTAKSTVQDQVNSLGAGADAYVVKPFNPEYLLALVKSLLDNRNRVRNMFNSSTSVPKSSKDTLSGQDRDFMEKMYEVMKGSISTGELDIDSVAESLGVSRSKFYYKVKALTGQTPNEFFTTYKLNYSLELLKAGKYKIAAISDMLGFSSASHFASLFKKKFGVLPSQYTN